MTPRPRHYVPGWLLLLLLPFVRYSPGRDAYVLHVIGNQHGPVLRRDLRRRQLPFAGLDRRGVGPEHAGMLVR